MPVLIILCAIILLTQIADFYVLLAQRLGTVSIYQNWLTEPMSIHKWNMFLKVLLNWESYFNGQNIHPLRTRSISSEVDLSSAEMTHSFCRFTQRSWLVLTKRKLLTWANTVYDWSERLIWIWNWDSKWTHCCWEVFDIIPHNASFLRRWLHRSTLCCGANFYLNIHCRVF